MFYRDSQVDDDDEKETLTELYLTCIKAIGLGHYITTTKMKLKLVCLYLTGIFLP